MSLVAAGQVVEVVVEGAQPHLTAAHQKEHLPPVRRETVAADLNHLLPGNPDQGKLINSIYNSDNISSFMYHVIY